MNILAIETATASASCALLSGKKMFSQNCDVAKAHSATFLPAVQKILDDSKTTRADLNAIAVDIGPGAFTGLRHGIATAQAFSLAFNLPILGVSSLKTLAFAVIKKAENAKILALLDARMREIYCAVFNVQNQKLLEETAPFLCAADHLPDLDFSKKIIAVGNIADNYPDFLNLLKEKNMAFFSAIPTAENVARLAESKEAQVFAANNLVPLYVRNKVADTTAERARKGFRL